MLRVVFLMLLLGRTALCLSGSDWPQFLGPSRDGSSPENVSFNWGAEGPALLWKKAVGQGFAGPVVKGQKVVVFHRVGDSDVIQCLKVETGEEIWKMTYPTTYRDDFGFDEGPRSTPTMTETHVFTMSAEGWVQCTELASGKKVWGVDTRKRFGARKGFFGMACAPLVEGGVVLMNIGGTDGAGIIGLEAGNGELKWKSTTHEASYSSPVSATLGGKTLAVFLTREGVVGVDPGMGKVQFEYPFRSRMHSSVNAATPLVIGEKIFVTASYDTGAALLAYKNGTVEEMWRREGSLSSHYASVVHHGGFVFGFDGRQEYGAALVCLDLATGKPAWREEGFGAGTVTLVGKMLFILKESGELVIAEASAKEFRAQQKAQVTGNCRAYPAVAGGKLYARDEKNLYCYRLGSPEKNP